MAAVSRKRAIVLRCGALAVSLILGISIAELALRALGVSFPQPYIADNNTGSRLQPGFSGWFTKEGRAFATINQAGFRDREHSLVKPANAFRILVLGDSYVEALQIPQQQTFWSVLEQRLGSKFPERHVEVLAMGVSGWGTAQQFQALVHYGFAYQPDVVVLAFFAANDVKNNSRTIEGDSARPYFVLEQDDLHLDDSFRSDPRFLKAKSAWTVNKVAIINRLRVLQLIQEIRERWKHRGQADNAANAGLDANCFREPEQDDWKNAWDVTERLIEEMNRECHKHNSTFLVAAVNYSMQVHPDEAERAAFCKAIGVNDLSYPDGRIKRLGERLNVPVLILAEPLLEYAKSSKKYLHGFDNTRLGDGHWNALGHRLAGEAIASMLFDRM